MSNVDEQNQSASAARSVGPTALLLTLALLAAACGDSESDTESSGATTTKSPPTTVNETTTSSAPATTPESTTTPATTDGAANEDTAGQQAEQPDFAVLVRGSLVTDDMAAAQQLHDAVAGGGQQIAQDAGDVAHFALLGTSLLGSTENEFLALDQWTSVEGLSAFYSNPDVAAGFATLFSTPPTSEIFERRYEWHQWGGLNNGADYTWVVVRGRLAAPDDAAAQAAHDLVAAGGEVAALGAGDVAHIVFTSVEDPAEYMSIDVWRDATNLELFYSNPDFAAAFGTLFAGPPTVGVYSSTDWVQW